MPKERLFFWQGLPNALEINISQLTSRINCRRVRITELFLEMKNNETWAAHHRNLNKQLFCQGKSILPFLRFYHLKVLSSFACTCVWLHLSLHFCYLSVLKLFHFVWHWFVTVVAARNFTSANFRNSDFSFVLLTYRAIFAWNFARNIVWHWNFSPEILRNFTKFHTKLCSKIRENKERNSPNFVCISFAEYCKSMGMSRVVQV